MRFTFVQIQTDAKTDAKRSLAKKEGLDTLSNPLFLLERETGFEPATFSLGS